MLPVIETFTEEIKQVNTLMQLATLTRNILQKLTIKDIQVVTLPDSYFKFKFVTEDGSTIETNSVFIGESISIDDALSVISTNPVQNKIITASINTINDAITVLQGTSLSTNEKEFVSSEYAKTLETDGALAHIYDIKGKLLWQNATPNTAFTNVNTPIEIGSLVPYDYIVVLWKQEADSTAAYRVSKFGAQRNKYMSLNSTSGGDTHSRTMHNISPTSVEFFNGYLNATEDNSHAVPVAIYGTNVL